MTEKVVFLAHRNSKLPTDITEFLACSNCHNKSFSAVYENSDSFPKLKCGACGASLGHFGWVDEDE